MTLLTLTLVAVPGYFSETSVNHGCITVSDQETSLNISGMSPLSPILSLQWLLWAFPVSPATTMLSQRQTARQRQTETDRQTDRDRQTETDRDRQTETDRQRDRQTERDGPVSYTHLTLPTRR